MQPVCTSHLNPVKASEISSPTAEAEWASLMYMLMVLLHDIDALALVTIVCCQKVSQIWNHNRDMD